MKTSTHLKTSFGIVTFAILGFTAGAQITLNQADMPQTGKKYLNAHDTTPTVTAGSAGTNQAWNLSAIKNQKDDTDFALLPSSTPYASYYSGSNLTIRSYVRGLGESYEYDNLGADSLVIQGVLAPFNGTIAIGTNKPYARAVKFPATYSSSWSSSYVNVEKYAIGVGDSVKGVILYSYTNTVDGWGNVTTPAGTFAALRIKEIFTALYDSVYENLGSGWMFVSTLSPVPTETYIWYGNGFGEPLATLIYDTSGGHVSTASYLSKVATGIDEISNTSSALVYPNPASSSISFVMKSANASGYVKILDITGRAIESSFFMNGKAQLNTFAYANGMYIYIISDVSGNLLDKGKFTIAH